MTGFSFPPSSSPRGDEQVEAGFSRDPVASTHHSHTYGHQPSRTGLPSSLPFPRESPLGDVGRKPHVEDLQLVLPDAWLLNAPEAFRLWGILLRVLVWGFLPTHQLLANMAMPLRAQLCPSSSRRLKPLGDHNWSKGFHATSVVAKPWAGLPSY